jgi:hypothetical protein
MHSRSVEEEETTTNKKRRKKERVHKKKEDVVEKKRKIDEARAKEKVDAATTVTIAKIEAEAKRKLPRKKLNKRQQ